MDAGAGALARGSEHALAVGHREIFAVFSLISGVPVARRPRDRVSWTILRARFRPRGPFKAPKIPLPNKKARNRYVLLRFDLVGGRSQR